MQTESEKTMPIGLIRYAQDYYDCAIAADRVVGRRPGYEIIAPVPVMYLVGHSIELCLKSYLLFRGVSIKVLCRRPYGHDLTECLRKAKELGLSSHIDLSNEDERVVKILSALYSKKLLNYIEVGKKTFPVFGPIQSVNIKLLKSVKSVIGYSVH